MKPDKMQVNTTAARKGATDRDCEQNQQNSKNFVAQTILFPVAYKNDGKKKRLKNCNNRGDIDKCKFHTSVQIFI